MAKRKRRRKKGKKTTIAFIKAKYRGKKKPSWYASAIKGGWNPYDSAD
jgi:hypothetical protein